MTIVNPSQGYPGALTPGLPWANMQKMLGRRYMVADQAAVKVTALGSGTRQVSVSAGFFGGHGILDFNDAAVTVTLPTVGSGTQYFLIVARRTWSTTNATTFQVINGGTTTTLPTRNTSPGTLDDQPLALVPLTAGNTVPGTPIDLRVIGSGHGEQIAMSDLVRQYLTEIGTQIRIVPTGTEWLRTVDGTGVNAVWQQLETPNSPVPLTELTQSDVWQSATGSGWNGTGDAGAVYCRAIPNGNRIDIYLNLRKGGARLIPDANGGIVDIPVGTVDPVLRPPYPVPAAFIYRGGPAATDKGSYQGACTLSSTGQVNLNSLAPGIPLNLSTGASDWSARFFFSFNRKG